MDLFVVPTLAFNLLYRFIIVRLDRRELVRIAVTNSPTADWIARQITEAFPWDAAPGYLIRDRDRVFGSIVRHRVCAMGIRDKPIAPRSPWQNGFAERLISPAKAKRGDGTADEECPYARLLGLATCHASTASRATAIRRRMSVFQATAKSASVTDMRARLTTEAGRYPTGSFWTWNLWKRTFTSALRPSAGRVRRT